jgi:hypothetical protein
VCATFYRISFLMSDLKIKSELEKFYHLLDKEQVLKFPSYEQITTWEKILQLWIEDKRLPLFVRKPANIRGSFITHSSNRKIIITDNTPAHWVYKKVVLNNEVLSLHDVIKALNSSTFPLAMMRKKIERESLLQTQIASKEFRLGHDNWKIAHIDPIALPRKKIISIDEYIKHHVKFLSLKNMYLIRKDFSGLAEVSMFNQLILNRSK